MENEIVVDKLKKYIRNEFANESTGHDWFHIERVWKVAKTIAKKEGGELFIIELGALLHDIADHKFIKNADKVAIERTSKILRDLGVDSDSIKKVQHIVLNCSFKGGIGENKMKSLEGLIVQDADRLDALGAIGIARTFAYGAKAGNVLYDPDVRPTDFKTAEEYSKSRTHTINHFYEKLLLLKDKMNTKTGELMAENRHEFMENYLNQFYAEWEGDL